MKPLPEQACFSEQVRAAGLPRSRPSFPSCAQPITRRTWPAWCEECWPITRSRRAGSGRAQAQPGRIRCGHYHQHPSRPCAGSDEAFQAAGAADVRIAEGPGHRRVTLDLADAAGYFTTIPDFEQRFTDLNTDEISRTTLRHPVSKLKELYLPRTALGCDLLVSMPKMKTHHWVGATLSMKNLFGIVPGGVYGWPKNVLHWAGIAESIVDLHHAAPRRFCIVDGIVGMEGNGPIQGRPKAAGVLVAGSDPISVDATCCRIMRIDPAKIEYLAMAGYDGGTKHPPDRREHLFGRDLLRSDSSSPLLPPGVNPRSPDFFRSIRPYLFRGLAKHRCGASSSL